MDEVCWRLKICVGFSETKTKQAGWICFTPHCLPACSGQQNQVEFLLNCSSELFSKPLSAVRAREDICANTLHESVQNRISPRSAQESQVEGERKGVQEMRLIRTRDRGYGGTCRSNKRQKGEKDGGHGGGGG